jgi:hypothetical protein
MNNLNNQQLMLLAILVSFVTSIATGIFTVALLDQAPPSVTSTINRVVERTVEVITPTEKETVIQEKIVVDRSGEVVVSAIEGATPALLEVGVFKTAEASTTKTFVKKSIGFFVSPEGALLAPSDKLTGDDVFYARQIGKDAPIELSLVARSSEKNLALLAPTQKMEKLPYLSVLGSGSISAGQTAIVLDPKEVSVTFISQILAVSNKNAAYKVYFENSGDVEGRPVVNVEGKVIGVLSGENMVIPGAEILSFIESTGKNTENKGEETKSES